MQARPRLQIGRRHDSRGGNFDEVINERKLREAIQVGHVPILMHTIRFILLGRLAQMI